MKTTFFITAILISFLFTACNDSTFEQAPISSNLKSITLDSICIDSVFTSTIDDLTEADISGLMLMREEEKMAHDVYIYFYEKYSEEIFDRIASSETKHAEAVLRLLNHFSLEDPTTNEAGVYLNEELQGLYNNLIAMGDESVEAALNVGGLIEETDILDLQNLLDATANADITTVYSKLLLGSFNHLKAFNRTLRSYDITYVPTILTQEEFDAILLTPNGNGNGNRNGQSGGNGQGNSQGGSAVCDSTGYGNGTPALDGQGNGQKGQGNKGNGKKGGRN